MNVLIAGSGSGSFTMRGHQIGAVLGARVTSDPTPADWAWANVAILIKRTAQRYAPAARVARVPIVWDALDCWSQPRDNRWTVKNGIAHVAVFTSQIKPHAVIGATEAMAHAIGGTYIPHHSHLGLVPTQPRERIRTVAYDGSERYLGQWRTALEIACARRGWQFVVNPSTLTKVDLLVAFRDGEWDGPICRAWKSGVKYVNAICAGRPILTQRGDAAEEIGALTPAVDVILDMHDLERAFDYWTYERRQAVYEHSARTAAAFTVEAIAETYYRPLLRRVIAEARCAA
jgi:hypothetical protein